MYRRGCPYDNVLMEKFFGTLKTKGLFSFKPLLVKRCANSSTNISTAIIISNGLYGKRPYAI